MASAAPKFSDLEEISGTTEHLNQSKDSNNNNTMDDRSDEAMTKLLQRMKADRMYELRNIKHSHRPVTGQEHRENLQQFMKKHIVDPTQAKGNVPANVDDVTEHRPQSVVVEVQGIVEQRPVSSVLQSAAFRHRLENIIRGSIQSSRRQSPIPSRIQRLSSQRTQRERTTVVPTQSNHEQGGDFSLNRQQTPDIAPRNLRERRDSTDSVDSFSSALSSVDQDDDFLEETSAPVIVPTVRRNTEHSSSPVPLPRRTLPSSSSARSSPAPPSASPSPRHNDDDTEAGISWNDISRVHREELVQELSELLHNRLVSSTLEGEFRATLEVLIEDRVDNNGPDVRDFVQSLPGRGIPRNDFSHLGIQGPWNDLDNSDNISIASVSAHSVPYTQTNTYLGREIQSLKGQMKDMMSMLKLTQELQLDIQRSIRQEVAAALSQHSSGDGASAAPITNLPKSKPIQDTHCLICLESYSDSVLYQCGHMCVCYLCGKNLISKKHCCPVCRAPIKDVIRTYKTNVE